MPVKVRDWAGVGWLSQSAALQKDKSGLSGLSLFSETAETTYLYRRFALDSQIINTAANGPLMARSMAWVVALARAQSVIKSDGRRMDTRRDALANLLDKRTIVR